MPGQQAGHSKQWKRAEKRKQVGSLAELLHELGHAYATRYWGGEVHEMGIMLLVFNPIPYVDASAASAARSANFMAGPCSVTCWPAIPS